MNKNMVQTSILKSTLCIFITTLAAVLLGFLIWILRGDLTVEAYSTVLFLIGLVFAVIGGAVYFGGYYGGRYIYMGKVASPEASAYDSSPNGRAGSGSANIFMCAAVSGVLAIAAALLILFI